MVEVLRVSDLLGHCLGEMVCHVPPPWASRTGSRRSALDDAME